MILSVEQVKDYQYCPMLYYYNHVEKRKPSKLSTVEKFAMFSLKQTFYWYFYEQQDGGSPDLKGLKDKFGNLFIYDRTYAETMFADNKAKARVLETRAVRALSNFNEVFSNNLGVPLLINKDYVLEFNKIKLAGTIPVIRETQYKELEMVSFTDDLLLSNKGDRNYKIEVQRDIDIIASSIAFKKVYGLDIDNHMAYGMYYGDAHICKVDGPLMLNLEKIVERVAYCISKEIYYPIYNIRCSNCAYRQACLKEW